MYDFYAHSLVLPIRVMLRTMKVVGHTLRRATEYSNWELHIDYFAFSYPCFLVSPPSSVLDGLCFTNYDPVFPNCGVHPSASTVGIAPLIISTS